MQGGAVDHPFHAVKLTDRVYWVGAIDWSVRNFHGYQTSRGTTYNAFLVLADRVALIDTVKAPFVDEMFARIASIIDPARIHTVVSNHTEMDHSGGLPAVIGRAHPERVLASKRGALDLLEHFPDLGEVTAVNEGESVSLGNATLSFMNTPMLHWPDSMFTYYAEEGILFSNDAFGMHLASGERFADELDEAILVHEGAKYYANILLPLSRLVTRLFEKVARADLDIGMIAPDHGPIWRRDVGRVLDLWRAWAGQERTNKAVVVFDTMWGSTGKMARAIGDGLASGGAAVKLMDLDVSHRSDVATEILDAGALLVGSPTLNNGIFPTVADAMTYIRGLKPQGLRGASFGSYGWSGEGVAELTAILDAMKVELHSEGLKVKYVPRPEDLARCRALGSELAEELSR
jgi:flavorubredoxin